MRKPTRLAFTRAPSVAFLAYSRSAPRMATVSGLGRCAAAMSK